MSEPKLTAHEAENPSPQKGEDSKETFAPIAPIPESSIVDPQAARPTLRKLEPYWHPFRTWAKQRWYGREILEMISTEFRDRSVEYYKFALESGVCTINGNVVRAGYIIKNGDLLENIRHRHEPPITSTPVKIIHRDEENGFIVIDKPGSIPVHGVGRYYYHSLVEILRRDFGIEKPYTVNRLDRLTSGCMFIATRVDTARMLTNELTNRVIRKEYVARVVGEFPREEIVVDQPMVCVDKQMGLNIVHPEGKPAKTIFNRMFYDAKSNTSVVHCQPLTGRSHQIRVHLQFIGHPIANDPVYSDLKVWGPNLGKGGLPTSGPDPHTKEALGDVLRSLSINSDGSSKVVEDSSHVGPNPSGPASQPPNSVNLTAHSQPNQFSAIASSEPLISEPDSIQHPTFEPASSLTPLLTPPEIADSQKPAKGSDPTTCVPQNESLLPRETGDDIGIASPVPIAPQTRTIITKLRLMKDEAEEYSRWRDVIFRTKAALKMQGRRSVHPGLREHPPQYVVQQRLSDERRQSKEEVGHTSSTTPAVQYIQHQEQAPDPAETELPSLSAEGELLAQQQPSALILSPDGKEVVDPTEFPYCEECFMPLYPDPKPSQLYIYLHALRYTTSKWSYATEMPFWALENWEMPSDDWAKWMGDGGEC